MNVIQNMLQKDWQRKTGKIGTTEDRRFSEFNIGAGKWKNRIIWYINT